VLFNSFDFAVFLPTVFLLYWFVFNKSLISQNSFLLFSSFIFYSWWDWRFLSLVLFSIIFNFYSVNILEKQTNENSRKHQLWLNLFVNIGLLGFFKFYDFFYQSLTGAFSFFGSDINITSLKIILPIGISFYTFQILSYVFDVYYEKIVPTKNILAFGNYVSFFPQLASGPIEQSTQLLPQFLKIRIFNVKDIQFGCKKILWGLFKKIVVADNCAEFANSIFNNHYEYNGLTLLLGAILFAFQIYGDFSGYSDIASGTAKVLGIKLMENFSFPYFSRNIPEFWKRWHISLTSWFSNYLYFPMAFSLRKSKKIGTILCVFTVFLVSGIWHGPHLHYIAWGFIHGLLFVPFILFNNVNNPFNDKIDSLPKLGDLHRIVITFLIISISAIFFRADNLTTAFDITFKIITNKSGSNLNLFGVSMYQFYLSVISIIYLIVNDYHLMKNNKFSSYFIPLSLFMILYFGHFKSSESFIYFQF
jgi:D-alanyl-lipoteichoic acid acyltransferase DltB (MBOAT superfamily)